MNDFFARQEDARRRSGWLVVFFALAVLAITLAVYLVAAVTRAWMLKRGGEPVAFWHPRLFLWTSAGTLGLIAIKSFLKIGELKGGGGVVATSLGARLVAPHTRDPQERQLRNVVEEMAIASGTTVPDLYLLESEPGINAFAAGHGINDAAICVTRGSVELLSRDELQGVVAHEFSHIFNGDMLLNIRLLGWLSGILVVSQGGEILFRGVRHGRGRGSEVVFLLGAALYAIGYIGYFFGELIKCAVSRQREFLGDASAVQFTRNPEGVAGALKKIGGLEAGARLDNPRATEVSHMCFGNALQQSWLHALDSHPPLEERIRRIEPRFNGRYPKVTTLPAPVREPFEYVHRPARVAAQTATPVLSGAAIADMLDQVGEPMQEHLELARRLLAELPEALLAASRSAETACALVYSLLLDKDPALRGRQEQLVEQHDSAAIAAELRQLIPVLDAVSPQVRLSLLDLSLPALRGLSTEHFQRLKATTRELSLADQKESLFEFALGHLLVRHLEPNFAPRPARAVQIYSIRGVQKECSRILTALARVGHRDETRAQAAFYAAALVLHEAKAEFEFLPAAECSKTPVEQALTSLEGTSPQIKRRLLAACLTCLVYDREVKLEEMELFRAIADALGCPVPPWLGATAGG